MPDIISQTEKLEHFPLDHYFSENMQRGQFGLTSLLTNSSLADDTSLSGLNIVKAFSDAPLANGITLAESYEGVMGQDASGYIYSRRTELDTWALAYKPVPITGYVAGCYGMILGNNGKLYYVNQASTGNSAYLAQAETYKNNVSAGTITVTNGSATISGSGTSFEAGDAGKYIVINGTWYKITNYISGTSISIDTLWAGSTQSGVSYTLYRYWNDTYKSFGSSTTAEWTPPFNYEGDVLIPFGYNLCRLNSDGSFNDVANPAFDIPVSLEIRCGSQSGRNILLGVNMVRGSRGYLILWDNVSTRSVAPWIPLKSKVQAMKPYGSGWIVVTQRELFYTDGYSIRTISEGIDPRLGETSFSVTPYGLEIIGDRVIIANQIGGYTRKRSGFYIFSVITGAFQYLAPLGTHTYNATPSALFLDQAQRLNASLQTTLPAKKHLTMIKESAPSRAYVITNPLAANGDKKHATGVKLDMAMLEGGETITAEITVKIASLNRRLWGIQKAKVAGSSTSQITVNGTLFGDVRAGDEITVMEGVNASLMRHIASISGQGTATEVWTLDEALTSNIEQDAYISITPFRKVAKKTVTNATELRDMYFDSRNKYKGKRFLVKAVISNANVPIEILNAALIAQDQGVNT